MKTSRYTELLWYLIQFLRRGVFALSDTGVGQKWNFSYSYFIWQPVDKLNFFDTSYSFFRRGVFALSDSAPDASFCLCCVLLLLLLLPEVKERIKFWHHSWTVIYFSRYTPFALQNFNQQNTAGCHLDSLAYDIQQNSVRMGSRIRDRNSPRYP